MKFRTLVTSGKEVLFVGHERGNATLPEEWLVTGRWKISMTAFDSYLSNHLAEVTFGSSIDGFLFGFEIADFEKWGEWFQKTSDYVSYRPKTKEILSVGQLRWTDVKDLSSLEQLYFLRGAVHEAINRISMKRRKPKHFAISEIAQAVDSLLEYAPISEVEATPAI